LAMASLFELPERDYRELWTQVGLHPIAKNRRINLN